MARSSNLPLLLTLLAGAGALFVFSRTQRGQVMLVDVAARVAQLGKSMSRGLRNNNPGNLVRTAIAWKGKVATPAQAAALGMQWDASKEQFEHPSFGVRAMARDLRNDFHVDKKQSIRALMSEFSPSFENPLAEYVRFVTRWLYPQVTDPQELDRLASAPLPLEARLVDMLEAIIQFENGVQPFRREELQAWANLA